MLKAKCPGVSYGVTPQHKDAMAYAAGKWVQVSAELRRKWWKYTITACNFVVYNSTRQRTSRAGQPFLLRLCLNTTYFGPRQPIPALYWVGPLVLILRSYFYFMLASSRVVSCLAATQPRWDGSPSLGRICFSFFFRSLRALNCLSVVSRWRTSTARLYFAFLRFFLCNFRYVAASRASRIVARSCTQRTNHYWY
jgi:hypothetical protein